jgi:hypothetical protein
MAEIGPAFVIARLECKRAPVGRDCFLDAIERGERGAQAVEGGGIVRAQLERAAARRDALGERAGAMQHDAEVAVERGRRRVERDRGAHVLQRAGVVVEREAGQRQHVQRGAVLRIDVEHAAQRGLAFGVALRLVMLVGGAHQRRKLGARGRRRTRRRRYGGAVHQRGVHVSRDARPVARPRLAKQPHRRIPRRVVAAGHPAPVGGERQHHPDRLAERAGEVRDRGVGRDHKIERRDHGGGLAEIAELRRDVGDGRALAGGEIGGARSDLQREPAGALDGEQRGQRVERD